MTDTEVITETKWDVSDCYCVECHPDCKSDSFTPIRWLLFGALVFVTAVAGWMLGY